MIPYKSVDNFFGFILSAQNTHFFLSFFDFFDFAVKKFVGQV
jgi:hypothetical protein